VPEALRILLTTTFKKMKLAGKYFRSILFFLLIFDITNRNFTAIVKNGVS